MFGLKLPRRRGKRQADGLTLVLWTPHPAQRDFESAMEQLGKIRSGPAVHSERYIGGITPGRLRHLITEAGKKKRPLIVLASLMADARLAPFAKRQVNDVRRLLDATDTKKVRVVLLLTSHDRLFEILYLKQVENGSTIELEDHVKKAEDVDLSYGRLIKGLQELSSVQSVETLGWARGEANLAKLLAAVAGDAVPSGALTEFDRPPRVRGYTSRRGIRVARAMHQFIDSPKEHALVRTFVRENFRARRLADTEHLGKEDRRRLRKRYAADAALFEDKA